MSIRSTERLAEAGVEPSVGSVGNSYDNALAESTIGLFKTEVLRRLGPGRNMEDVELATLEWVWWFNYHRLLRPIGHVPTVEFEEAYYKRLEGPTEEAGLKENTVSDETARIHVSRPRPCREEADHTAARASR